MRSQNANRMLTLFRKICFDGKNSKRLVSTRKTPKTPVKSMVSGVLKGAEKRSKCSKRHPLPRTRNQFASNRTRVRIPPAAPTGAGERSPAPVFLYYSLVLYAALLPVDSILFRPCTVFACVLPWNLTIYPWSFLHFTQFFVGQASFFLQFIGFIHPLLFLTLSGIYCIIIPYKSRTRMSYPSLSCFFVLGGCFYG